jgi:hypothetical protein
LKERYRFRVLAPSLSTHSTFPDDYSRALSAITPMIEIKETVSHHSLSLNRLGWGRPILDVTILNKLLSRLIEDEDTPAVAGKK